MVGTREGRVPVARNRAQYGEGGGRMGWRWDVFFFSFFFFPSLEGVVEIALAVIKLTNAFNST